MNIKKKKKYIKFLIIGIIICMIILCIILIFLIKKSNKSLATEEEINPSLKEEQIEKYIEGKTIPQGISTFIREYTGNVTRDDLYEKLYISSRFLPDLNSHLKDTDDFEKYYEENSEEIKKYIGISNSTDFVQLANYLIKNDISEDEFNYCSYEGDMYNFSEYSIFTMKFNYINYGNIEFTIKLLNSKTNDKSILVVLAPSE